MSCMYSDRMQRTLLPANSFVLAMFTPGKVKPCCMYQIRYMITALKFLMSVRFFVVQVTNQRTSLVPNTNSFDLALNCSSSSQYST